MKKSKVTHPSIEESVRKTRDGHTGESVFLCSTKESIN